MVPKLDLLGNRADYVLGTTLGWDAFDVVRWRATEAISRPFRFEITLLRRAERDPVDLDALLDSGATLAVASESRWRMVHGVVTSVEELERTGVWTLHRLALEPHIVRARFRRRCRNFVDRTLEDIVTTVLENRSPARPAGHRGLSCLRGAPEPPDLQPSFAEFVEPRASYRWAVAEPERIRDASLRPYVVQYNESDLELLERLLAEAGLSYYFEHARDASVLVVSDRPGQAPLFERDERHLLRSVAQAGAAAGQEVLRSLGDVRRLRSRSVAMREFDFRRSLSVLEADVLAAQHADKGSFEHFEFPGNDELDPARPGLAPATHLLERFEVERRLAEGTATVRTLEPGHRFRMRDADGLRPDGELTVVAVETFATQLAPGGTVLDREPFGFSPSASAPAVPSFESRFSVLPADVRFRPERVTDKPRIAGVQTAMVTAEETAAGQAIHADALGRVRLRFPWDQRPPDGKSPSSDWVRVSQVWAGGGYGALHVPRVGHEVLVAFLHGDPERPVVVGRVYNEQNRPPYDPTTDPTVSTVKSRSATRDAEDAAGSNELRFTDEAKKEQVYLHAQRNLDEVVRACHSTSVGGDQSNSVGGNQANAVKGSRAHVVDGTETLAILGDRNAMFASNEQRFVGASRSTEVTATDRLETATRVTIVKGDDMSVVSGQDAVQVTGNRTVQVGANHLMEAGANHTVRSTNTYFEPAGDFQVNSTTAGFNQAASFYVKAGGCTLRMSAGVLLLDNGAGASVALVGGAVLVTGGAAVVAASKGLLSLSSSGPTNLVAGGDFNAAAPTIKLNG